MLPKTRTWILICLFATTCLTLPAIANAQIESGTSGGSSDEGNLGLPRDNVRGGAIASRAPGNWINQAIGRHSNRQSASLRNFGGVEEYQTRQESNFRENLIIGFIQWLQESIVNIVSACLGIEPDENGDENGNGNGTEDDQDGDGIPDNEDNCPTTPNNDQADTDQDGIGDACDACPDTPTGLAVLPNGCAFPLTQEVFVDDVPNVRYLAYDGDDPAQADDTFDFIYAGCNASPCTLFRIDLLTEQPVAEPILPATMQLNFPAGIAYSEDPVIGLIDPVEDVLLTHAFESQDVGFWWIEPQQGFKTIIPISAGENFPGINPGALKPADMALDSQNQIVFLDHPTQGLYRIEQGEQALVVNLLSQLIPEDQLPSLDTNDRVGNVAIDTDNRIYVYAADQQLRVIEENDEGEFTTTVVNLQSGEDSLFCQTDYMPMAFGPGGLWQNNLHIICNNTLYRLTDTQATPMADLESTGIPVDMVFSDAQTLYLSELPTDTTEFTTGRINRLFLDCNDNGISDILEDDTDGDGFIDDCDNCPETENPDQLDSNEDGIGDACNE